MLIQTPVHALVRDRSDNMWQPVDFQHVDEMKQLVEGPMSSYSLPFNLELWLNKDHHHFKEEGPTLIIPDIIRGRELLFFGNCFLTSCDPYHQITSLSSWQKNYIFQHSELLKSLTPDVVTAVLLNIEVEFIN